jgi:PAS domain S-box-containing protein
MKTRFRSNRAVLLAFGSAILALLVVSAISYRSVITARESDQWVRHTHDVLDNLQDLRFAMEEIQSSAHTFALTGENSSLVAYRSDIASAARNEEAIRNLTVDNPLQQSRIPALEAVAESKIRRAATLIDLRKTKGLAAAADEVRSGPGQTIMDNFEAAVSGMRGEELRLLTFRRAEATRDLDRTRIILILGTLLGLSIVAAAGLSAQRDNANRRFLEGARREGEELFHALANNIPQLAWMGDGKGNTFWYNQRWLDYSGTSLAEMTEAGSRELIHPDHRKRVVDKAAQCYTTGQIFEDAFPIRGRDGKYHWFLSRAVPISDPNGKVLRWFGTNTDMSVGEDAKKHVARLEGRYRGLLEAAPDAMVVVNEGGEIVLLNVQAEKQFGYSRDELLGQKVTNIIPRGFAERLIADGTRSAADALAQQIGTGIELIALRKDGSEFPIEIMLSPLESTEGILVTAAIRNISVRNAADAHLAQMEGRYRALLEAAPDGMVVVSQSGEIVLLNVQAEKQFGYSRDELLGQKVTNIIPEGFAERLIADGTRSAAEALAQQIGTGIELSGLRKDRSRFPIEIMLSPLESPEGILVTAAVRDISVRKVAEVHLAQMEGRYRGLLEAAPDAMVVVNRAGAIVLLNVQAEKQFGYSRNELLGRKIKDIIPEGFAERLIADALRSADDALTQQIGTGIELSGLRKDGSEFPIEIMLSPLESAEGFLVTAAIRNIATRKQAEANLLKNIEELNRSNEELGQFAYIASHDLQEPLRMVASYTQLLSKRYKGKLDADADEFIAFAVDGANRMQQLIEDLLTYSRVGTKANDLREISSEQALQKALGNLGGAVHESSARVTHGPLPTVRADETQLIQLFQNLVGNGIKYHGSSMPQIHISAAMNGERKWMFSVKDNGLGIDPQYFEKIFGMFQRLHKREEFDGTGIGLAICKKIVERHGGAISVESQPGHGSTFRFALAGSEANS